MKKLLLSVTLLIGISNVQAQVEFAAKGGVNLSTVTGDDVGDVDMGLGVNVGAFAKIGISDAVFVQPGLEVSQKGYTSNDGDLRLMYLDIPVLLKYQANDEGFFGEVGPNFGLLLAAKADVFGADNIDVKESFSGTDFGLNFGAGYILNSGLGLGARYNLGLANIADDSNYSAKNSVIQIYAFWTFGN